MIRPFKGTFTITQEWGVNPADYARFGLKGHNGVDYGTPTGTSIIAPHSGKVIESAFDQYGYGMYIKIENDVEGSILAHLDHFTVNAGDTVSEGQEIGISDNTGNSTGPHLHWGYYRMPRNKSDGFSGTTNPFPYLTENNPPPGSGTPPTSQDEKDKLIEQLKEENHKKDEAITQKDDLLKVQEVQIGKLSEELKQCQTSSSSSAEFQDKLDILQKRYDKLASTPAKAILSVLLKIAENLKIQL